jgi:hypothetical protein
MSAAIASQLECLPDTTIMAWDTLEMPWREKIQAAIALWVSAAREKLCQVSCRQPSLRQ